MTRDEAIEQLKPIGDNLVTRDICDFLDSDDSTCRSLRGGRTMQEFTLNEIIKQLDRIEKKVNEIAEAIEQPEIVHRKRQSAIKPKHNNVSDETKEMIDQLWRAQK